MSDNSSSTGQKHPYHLVDPSPWPILASGSVSTLLGGSVLYFYGVLYSVLFVRLSFILNFPTINF